MKVLSLLALGLICLYSVSGEEHLFKSETHDESGFLFNRIERNSEGLNDQGIKGIFLAGSSQHPKYEDDGRAAPKSGTTSSTQSNTRRDDRGAQTTQTNKPRG